MWIKVKGGLLNTDMVSKFTLDGLTGDPVSVIAEYNGQDYEVIAKNVSRERGIAIIAQIGELVGVMPKQEKPAEANYEGLYAALLAAKPAEAAPAEAKPAKEKPNADPAKVSALECRRMIMVLWHRLAGDMKREWVKYLTETYGTADIAKIEAEYLAAIYQELHAALSAAGQMPDQENKQKNKQENAAPNPP